MSEIVIVQNKCVKTCLPYTYKWDDFLLFFPKQVRCEHETVSGHGYPVDVRNTLENPRQRLANMVLFGPDQRAAGRHGVRDIRGQAQNHRELTEED